MGFLFCLAYFGQFTITDWKPISMYFFLNCPQLFPKTHYMAHSFVNLTLDNIDTEHLCCAISDKKHAIGVSAKKKWLKDRITEGHVFRKATVQGKVFIEYAPLESAWVPILKDNYFYIYCLWVSGSYKNSGYGKELLTYCIDDAKEKNKSGICVLSSKKKKLFLSDKKFFTKYGFKKVAEVGEYELLALSFDDSIPTFSASVQQGKVEDDSLTIFYDNQCPYIPHQIEEVKEYCEREDILLTLIPVETLNQAKHLPTIFNNWAVFYKKEFKGVHLLNSSYIKKLIL